MKSIYRLTLLCALCSLTAPAFADIYFCPTTTKNVQTGATINDVIAACGQPTTRLNSQAKQKTTTQTFQWIFTRGNPTPTQMILEIENNIITSIKIGGNPVTFTNFCGSAVAIRKGTPAQSVLSYCGRPGIINQIEKEGPTIEQVELIYKERPYLPASVFIFEGGKLVDVRKLQ